MLNENETKTSQWQRIPVALQRADGWKLSPRHFAKVKAATQPGSRTTKTLFDQGSCRMVEA